MAALFIFAWSSPATGAGGKPGVVFGAAGVGEGAAGVGEGAAGVGEGSAGFAVGEGSAGGETHGVVRARRDTSLSTLWIMSARAGDARSDRTGWPVR